MKLGAVQTPVVAWAVCLWALYVVSACSGEPPSSVRAEPLGSTTAAIAGGELILETDPLAKYVVRFHTSFQPYDDGTGLCTATVIGDETAVTAAHCVICGSMPDSWIMFGSADNSDGSTHTEKMDLAQIPENERQNYPERYYVLYATLHPYYQGAQYDCSNIEAPVPLNGAPPTGHAAYDLAVLHLDRQVPAGKGLAIADVMTTLPVLGYSLKEHPALQVGAGYTSAAYSSEDLGVLRKGNAHVQGFPFTSCPTPTEPLANNPYLGMQPDVTYPGDSGGGVFFDYLNRWVLVGVNSTAYSGVYRAAPTFTAINGAFLRNELGLPAIDTTDTDCDGIQDEVDDCVDASNADQEDSNGNGIGDACDYCPFTAPYDTTNSNRLAEEALEKDTGVVIARLPDVCDAVPVERPDRIVPGWSSISEMGVQGDGTGPDDLIELRSSTFVGRVSESDPVASLGAGTTSFYWCNCIHPSYPDRIQSFALCAYDAYFNGLCSTETPAPNSTSAWRPVTLLPKSPSAPVPVSGSIAREFWFGQEASAATWNWLWYQDLTSAGSLMLPYPSLPAFQYTGVALLAHVNHDVPIASTRDETTNYELRNTYRPAVTGPVVVAVAPPPNYAEPCSFPNCKAFFGPFTDCPMCAGPLTKLESSVNPVILTSDGVTAGAIRVDGRATDVTSELPASLISVLAQTRAWIRPSEPSKERGALGRPYELVSFPRDFTVGDPPAVVSTLSQQRRAACSLTSDLPERCSRVNLRGGRSGAEREIAAGMSTVRVLHDPAVAFSAVEGLVLVLGPPTPVGHVQELLRYELAPQSWTSQRLTGAWKPSDGVKSVAYDRSTKKLYVLELLPHLARLGVIDTRTGGTKPVASWPRMGLYSDASIHIAADRSLVVVGRKADAWAAWFFRVNDSGIRLKGIRVGVDHSVDRPFMGTDDLVLPIRVHNHVKLEPIKPSPFLSSGMRELSL